MKVREEAFVFACADEALVGILARPESPSDVGVVVVVGGPQYRVGSHRQFVQLSRAIALAGHAVLRFDYRGMGDSSGKQRDFADVSTDIGAAIDALQSHVPAVQRIALWGLCDGASAALLYCQATADPRVAGLCLANPWVRSEASLARAHVKHYYTRRLMERTFWGKLLSGKVAGTALQGLWQNFRSLLRPGELPTSHGPMPFQHRMSVGWTGFGGRILLLVSGEDYTAKEFLEYARSSPQWSGLIGGPRVVRHDLPGADHTFSDAATQTQAERLTVVWLQNQLR